jgi:hypothetical protein
VTIGLLSLFGMLSTIDFNRKAEARTIEIERVRPDWMLPSEMKTIELIAAKRMPKPCFGVSHLAAELSCSCGHGFCAGKA